MALIAILIACTAFFVVSEFAIVRVRESRISQLVAEGNKKALAAQKVTHNLDGYLAACQLGITITALGIGWLGEETIQHLLEPLFMIIRIPSAMAQFISFGAAFAIITFLHVVLGELAPKTFAIQKAESITMFISAPLIVFYKIMFPFIWILNGTARGITGLFGLKPAKELEMVHSEEELRMILSESYKNGEINKFEYKYVNKIFEFDNRIAKEIMVPRTEVVALSKNDTIEDFITLVHNEKFTRYPIIDGDKDHIIGMVNMKEIMSDVAGNNQLKSKSLIHYFRPIIRVIDTFPIQDLLLKMQQERIHMAVLMDEYGGTSGIVTVEDIIEEIVGEIHDEFDLDEVPMIQKIDDDHYLLDAKVLVSEVNELLGLKIDDSDIDTIGGWILTEKYEAKQGDTLYMDTFAFKIVEMEDHHIKTIEVIKMQMPSAELEKVEALPLIPDRPFHTVPVAKSNNVVSQ
ncbi:HlyC/CorC family transporter [Bacillaceae bacterium Marseille-Q3522]|nr:HlyC/CorC family transporter [Bacillaceae bacterium Marseille-Q3522]